jgi:hypothetical protein
MPDELESILRRVASGELTPEQAEPLVAAVAGSSPRTAPPPPAAPAAQRSVRLQVLEDGRAVVNLRIPMSLASLAGNVVPGLSGPQAERIREAIRSGIVGTILDVRDEDGDGVIISTE